MNLKKSLIPTLALSTLLLTTTQSIAANPAKTTSKKAQNFTTTHECEITNNANGSVTYNCHHKVISSTGEIIDENNVVGTVQDPKKLQIASGIYIPAASMGACYISSITAC